MNGSRASGVLAVLVFAGLTIAGPAVIAVRQTDSRAGDTRGAADVPKVVMRNLKFEPATLTIKRGTTVHFENADVAPHTVTAADGEPDSGIIGPGKAFDLEVTEPLDYVCAVHPSMKATIELSG
ncbi:MAG TPA: plastocyanin/azurin family copper-binding protein [Acidimicrobiales bacterium]|nr:plastocyanin/azurin family copper-binding protein [Acidimicrobiales bacterium]